MPVGHLINRISGRTILTMGMALAALGYALAGFSTGMMGLCAALILSGWGSSTQHPIASAAISHAYGKEARGPLSIYNFSGDLGKAAIPASTTLLITFLSWRQALWVISVLGLIGAVGLAMFVPAITRNLSPEPRCYTEQSERMQRLQPRLFDRRARYQCPDGIAVIPAFSPKGKRRIAGDHWRLAFIGVYRRRRGEIRVRMAGRPGWV